MALILSPLAKQRFFDANGAPLIGGRLWTYQAGTLIPLATYADDTGTAANTNPVILDGAGQADLWLATPNLYKLALEDANGVPQWTVDNVDPTNSFGGVLTQPTPFVGAGQIGIGTDTSTSVGSAGAADALPTTPSGYLVINIEGAAFNVPYYNSIVFGP